MNAPEVIQVIEQHKAAHYICADSCDYGRSTVLVGHDKPIVVSTVGKQRLRSTRPVPIYKQVIGSYESIGGAGRMYETMVFHANKCDCGCDMWIGDGTALPWDGVWCLDYLSDDAADAMHRDACMAVRSQLCQS